QLFAALRTGGRPAAPGEVLGGFLRAAGIPPEDIPDGTDERGKLFRTWCSDRRVLILLDDADSGPQIQPLLPGSAGCAVVVTSRSALHGLAGAHMVRLGPLTAAEGLHLLAGVVGAHRVEAEPRAAEQIVHLCGRLPLALRIAAARTAAAPAAPLASLAERLADTRARLRTLAAADLDVRTAFQAVYDRLPAPERSLFRLLGLLRTPHITVRRTAALLGCGPDHAEHLLARLAARYLLDAEPRPGGEVRYTAHDLVRLFARQCLEDELDAYRDPADPADPPAAETDGAGPAPAYLTHPAHPAVPADHFVYAEPFVPAMPGETAVTVTATAPPAPYAPPAPPVPAEPEAVPEPAECVNGVAAHVLGP
ncbi:NB-ARC domain-containing protein, partial [Sphaerisporangium aureirubrum]|uniref:NB-ARC domain-containing protein n=1 Tax=Sphaerisporangium aureirubrum TaxID=1544736 RepID=UPI0036268394